MLHLENVYKQFRNGFLALESVNLQVKEGEIVSIIGTSGCGKSTLLRLIAGLDAPSSGYVTIDNELITAPHPKVGIIFQEPRLMPWLTVERNVQFGLAHLPKPERQRRSNLLLERVGLTQFSQALPRQLSGGMAQRTAIARALVTQPSILLLDEPFSALDAFTREQLQDHVLQIWEYDRPTVILVTHDVEEALVLSDRIIVMQGHPGHIHQELEIPLPRPRKRTESSFQHWKETLLRYLDLSEEGRSVVEV
ncbi:ABC transporter ATP-binding protein [Egbenema bharatensis]|uniref:ABC transporter ATP-binding protein n=1 Tax=Egbenema bharatensis TaxID=3463334 RepID=UPI003A8B9021